MATVAVLPPFPTLFDNAGKPLDAGFVYVGEENQDPVANPIAIFWDAAMTIPAPNPFRTTAGFYSRSGSPGNIFAADNYSMRVCDKGNTQLYVIPSSARVGLGDIVLSSGERLIAEANSLIEVQDGASVFIGTNDGLGVNVAIADNARFIGNIVPAADGTQSVGIPGNRVDVFADVLDATTANVSGTLTAGSVRGAIVAGSSTDKSPDSDLALASLNLNKCILASGFLNSGVIGNEFNVASVATIGTGQWEATLNRAVPDGCAVIVTGTGGGSSNLVPTVGWGDVSPGTSGLIVRLRLATLTAGSFPIYSFVNDDLSFAVVGPPRVLP